MTPGELFVLDNCEDKTINSDIKEIKLTEKSQLCNTVPIDVMKQAFSECLDAFRQSNNKEE